VAEDDGSVELTKTRAAGARCRRPYVKGAGSRMPTDVLNRFRDDDSPQDPRRWTSGWF
jgi:hypothetical protein